VFTIPLPIIFPMHIPLRPIQVAPHSTPVSLMGSPSDLEHSVREPAFPKQYLYP